MKVPNRKAWRDASLVVLVLLVFQLVMLTLGNALPWANFAVVAVVLAGVRLLFATRPRKNGAALTR